MQIHVINNQINHTAAANNWPADTVIATPPGVGVYGPLRQFRRIKLPAGDRSARERAIHEHLATWGVDATEVTIVGAGVPTERSHGRPEPIVVPELPEARRTVTDNVQFLVKSFRRFASLLELVESITRYYPEARILIADDSFTEQQNPPRNELVDTIKAIPTVSWLSLPFDSGLSFGRNRLVEQADADYVCLLDDDFVFTPATQISRFVSVLDHDPSIDLIAGLTQTPRRGPENYSGHFAFTPSDNGRQRLNLLPLSDKWRTDDAHPPTTYRRTDLAFNFHLARREVLVRFPWDERFKICFEHMDHFLSLHAAGARVAYTPDVIVVHNKTMPAEYRRFRKRKNEYQQLFLDKWNLIDLPGHVARAESRGRVEGRKPRAESKTRAPNLIVLGVGHSGTTQVTRLLQTLGWNLGPADEKYAEHVIIREINQQNLRSSATAELLPLVTPDLDIPAGDIVAALPQPWAIKDPRFVLMLDRWLDTFAPYRPTLLWLRRDLDATKGSYARRDTNATGEPTSRGHTIDELEAKAQAAYDAWPWAKQLCHFEDVAEWAAAFDVDRALGTQHA